MNRPAQSFRDLIVWQKAHELVLAIYRITRDFPKAAQFGLTSQVRCSAVSVAANMAEGFGKRGKADRARFMNTAQGSLEEVHYYLILGTDLGYGPCLELETSYHEVGKLLTGYRNAILNSNS